LRELRILLVFSNWWENLGKLIFFLRLFRGATEELRKETKLGLFDLLSGGGNSSSFNIFLFFFQDYLIALLLIFFYFCSLCLFYFCSLFNWDFFALAYFLFFLAFDFFSRFYLFIFFYYFNYFWYFRGHDKELLGNFDPRWLLRLPLFKKITEQVSYFNWRQFTTLNQNFFVFLFDIWLRTHNWLGLCQNCCLFFNLLLLLLLIYN
jgi:hypothetical protein